MSDAPKISVGEIQESPRVLHCLQFTVNVSLSLCSTGESIILALLHCFIHVERKQSERFKLFEVRIQKSRLQFYNNIVSYVNNITCVLVLLSRGYILKPSIEYLLERFSEVLNVQHHYSSFLLIDEFSLLTFS